MTPALLPIFATPFASVSLPQVRDLHPALVQLIAGRSTPANRDPLYHQDPLCYRSREDLFEWQDAAARTRQQMLAGICRIVMAANLYSRGGVRALTLQAQARFAIVSPTAALPPRICPCFLVRHLLRAAPAAVPPRPDSAALRLYEPSHGQHVHGCRHLPDPAAAVQPFRALCLAACSRRDGGFSGLDPARSGPESRRWRPVLVIARARFAAPGRRACRHGERLRRSSGPSFAVPLAEGRFLPGPRGSTGSWRRCFWRARPTSTAIRPRAIRPRPRPSRAASISSAGPNPAFRSCAISC